MEKYLKKSRSCFVMQIVLFILLLAADRITKAAARTILKDGSGVTVINRILSFLYVENTGAAFGILKNGQWVFIVLSIIIIAAVIIFFILISKALKRYCLYAQADPDACFNKRTFNSAIYMEFVLVCLGAGALGNLIDRIFYGYVTDFIKLEFINFPVFNFADILITLSIVALLVYLIFFYKEDKNFSLFKQD